ncbi:acyl--CoA ligase [Phyllobacterium sp. 21LDTY02-6]|uniref:class I adenylate-forming enzyme family protein n=1 Tax=Phyllobacterium sp. 21LDTY02-6 TaxID=2944903 RepID=UPI002021395C|nr:class I adenylate-forming enzyme family protein [Phyllobacterium sp. 21LDTY02-6]MCO4319161.1 acyl--CoA ligase [Phyllobacterium sp. 21LDTY02-6]
MPTGSTSEVTRPLAATPITQETWAGLLKRAHQSFPGSRAVLTPGGWYTYDDVLVRARKVAAWMLQHGIAVGARIVLALDNRWEMLVVERALALWGWVRVALSPRLHPEEIDYVIEDCNAALIICESRIAEALRSSIPIIVPEDASDRFITLSALINCDLPTPPAPSIASDDLASLMYTSGTTGRPKGAMNSHGSWFAMATNTRALLPTIGEGDVLLHAAPMSHFSGSVASAFAAYGGAIALMYKFDPSTFVDQANRVAATCIPMVPTMIGDLVLHNRSGPIRSLRSMPYGGSTISPETIVAARQMFGNVLLQIYGMSEALIPVSSFSARDQASSSEARLRSAGKVCPNIEVRLANLSDEVGEIQVRGQNVMSGYWNRPAETAEVLSEDGWYSSGDLGRFDTDGYLEIVGRKRDVLISGGFNIYPAEIERVISRIPEIAEVAVVSQPDPRWGEKAVAVVACKPGSWVSVDHIIDHCCQHLASYKKPSQIFFVEKLPKTSTGKISKSAIRQLLDQEA